MNRKDGAQESTGITNGNRVGEDSMKLGTGNHFIIFSNSSFHCNSFPAVAPFLEIENGGRHGWFSHCHLFSSLFLRRDDRENQSSRQSPFSISGKGNSLQSYSIQSTTVDQIFICHPLLIECCIYISC